MFTNIRNRSAIRNSFNFLHEISGEIEFREMSMSMWQYVIDYIINVTCNLRSGCGCPRGGIDLAKFT